MIRALTFVLGPLKTNTYILYDEHSRDAVIVDPGSASTKILDFVTTRGLRVRGIIATHGHFDHVLGVDYFREALGSEFYINRLDVEVLYETTRTGLIDVPPKPDVVFEGDSEVRLGSIVLMLLHTPGHTPGSTCLHLPQESLLFTGDTLFHGSVGRTDLPGGSTRQLVHSIKKLYQVIGDRLETSVYPGHGPPTTLKRELEINLFVKRAVGVVK